MVDLHIRTWRPDDETAVASLLGPHPDPHWLAQRSGIHGIGPRPDRYAITLVAELTGQVVAVATLYENRYHRDRYPATVEVRPDHRRQGIGRQLVHALLAHRPHPLPLEVKLRDANTDAMAFATHLNMTTFQHCPVPTLDPTDPQIRSWAESVTTPAGATILGLDEWRTEPIVDALVDQYEWMHQAWSPMSDREVISQIWRRYVDAADAHLTTLAIVNQRVAAVALISVEDSSIEGNVETTTRDEPDGTALVTACLAQSILRMSDAGHREGTFDGHDDDPHFIPALNAVPNITTDPISLLELRTP